MVAVVDEELARRRDEISRAHMAAENAHDFPACIAAFTHARYELVPTGEIYDGPAQVEVMLIENRTAFPDFHFDVEAMHHAETCVVVEGTFRGTHLGVWRGLPATGRTVAVPMSVFFRFEEDRMLGERVFFDLYGVLQQLGVAHDLNSVPGKLVTLLTHPVTMAKALSRGRRSGKRA